MWGRVRTARSFHVISKNTPCRPNRALAGARGIWPSVSWDEFRAWVQEHVCRQWRGTLLSYLGGSRPRGPDSSTPIPVFPPGWRGRGCPQETAVPGPASPWLSFPSALCDGGWVTSRWLERPRATCQALGVFDALGLTRP